MKNFKETNTGLNLKKWWSFFNKKNKTKTMIILMIIFGFLLFFPPAAFFILFIYFSYIFKIMHIKFLESFAEKNNMVFQKKMDHRLLKGRLFNYGHSKSAYNLIYGKYNKNPIKIFNYSYTTGSGKNSRRHHNTILEVEIEKTEFPFILLIPKVFLSNIFNRENKISLEKKYSNKFELYCEEDYEIEVLQIFTKELLDFLIEHGNKFSIEFSGNKIYFYDDLIIKKETQLNELYDVVKKVLDKSGGLLHRLHDDFDSMHKSYRK